MKQILLLLLTFACLSSFAQPGAPDGLFGTGGKVTTPIGANDDFGYATFVQPDGKILVAGSIAGEGGFDIALLRYNPDGSLDNTFDGDGKVITDIGNDDSPNTIARQTDGKIVVAGYTTDDDGNYDIMLVRYNPDGSLDNSFGTGGKVTTNVAGDDDGAYGIAIQPGGKIVVVGYAGDQDVYDIALVRYNPDGSLDNSFGTGGKVTTNVAGDDDGAYGIAIQSNGKIVVSGYASDGESYDFAVVRYNDNGSLDNTFGSGGKVITNGGSDDEGITSLSIQPDGKIVAAGITDQGGDYDIALVRYNDNGSLDNTFGSGGKVTTNVGGDDDEAWGISIQSDGKILVGGFTGNTTTGNSDFVLLRYTAAGTPDPLFGTGGKATVDFGGTELAFGMAVYGTRIYLAGFTDVNGSADFALAALLNDVAAPLPLTLTSFAATRKPNSVQLDWTTVNEQNISSFEVTRSGDGRSFASVGSVKAVGNSSSKETYTFTDAQPLTGTNHYRLKVVEAGGKTTYSSIVAVKMSAFAKLEVFPNPVRSTLNVQFTATAARPLQIRDAAGRVVKTVSVSQTGNLTIPVDVSSLQKGVYFVQAEGETARFMKE